MSIAHAGSMERFFGVLLGHHGGALPVWGKTVSCKFRSQIAVFVSVQDVKNAGFRVGMPVKSG
jgi:hypothetical protein